MYSSIIRHGSGAAAGTAALAATGASSAVLTGIMGAAFVLVGLFTYRYAKVRPQSI